MKIGKTLYVKDRKKWRAWLKKNFDKKNDIWLIYPHKNSGKARIPYNDAVEEALAFGWIDSTVKKFDKHSSAQRFTPRKPGSNWSQPNKERLRWLQKNNLLHSSVKAEAKKILKQRFVIPKDLVVAVKKNKKAYANYKKFSTNYKRIRMAYIDDARSKPEEFKRRLRNFIKKTEQGKMIGYGGIEKYY